MKNSEAGVSLPLRCNERGTDPRMALTVVTSDDLRRQGAVTLPEALPLASGVFVVCAGATS